MEMLGIGIDLMSILVVFAILIGVLLGKKNAMNCYFPVLLLLHIVCIFANMGTLVFNGDPGSVVLLKICWIMDLCLTLVDVAGFNFYVDVQLRQGRERHFLYRMLPFIMVSVVAVMCILSMETGWIVQINSKGKATYGPYYMITVYCGMAIAIFDLAQVIYHHYMGKIDFKTAFSLYFFVGFPMLTLPFRGALGNQSMLFAAMTMAYFVMFLLIHVSSETRVVAEAAEKAEIHTGLTISQLQPHFLINALTSIRYLIKTDPKKSEEALGKFTQYLRRNIDLLDDSDILVPFSEEMEHTEIYLWLEQLRFGKKLRVEYSIDVDDFMVPPLCLQPIVENAVKHGVTKKIGGGRVLIQVRDTDKYYKIVVTDDGVGFDTARIQEHHNEDVDEMGGINRLRRRISQYKGSTISVQSSEGIGTVVIYQIKKD